MEFICNIYEPRGPQSVWPHRGRTRIQVYQDLMRWLADKVIGDPEPADGLDAKTLRQLGIVGVYRADHGAPSVESRNEEAA